MCFTGQVCPEKRIGNPVKVRNASGAVNAYVVSVARAGHWETEKAGDDR